MAVAITWTLLSTADIWRSSWTVLAGVAVLAFSAFLGWGNVHYSSWRESDEKPRKTDFQTFLRGKLHDLFRYSSQEEFEGFIAALKGRHFLADSRALELVKAEVLGEEEGWRPDIKSGPLFEMAS